MDELKFELQDDEPKGGRIKVIGIGGAGSNTVERILAAAIDGVDYYAINTDARALSACRVPNKLQIGGRLTGGLGAGSDPSVGRAAALEDTESILGILEGAELVFISAGLGGGTGAGAAPVVASLARQIGALTIAIVTRPFAFEGARRIRQAETSAEEVSGAVDIMTIIPNDRLLDVAPRGTSVTEAFRFADAILSQAVEGISEVVLRPGLVNVDFADVRAAISGMGRALICTASATGPDAALDAARAAIASPLLEDSGVVGARQVLINFTGSAAIGLHAINEACSIVRDATASDDLHMNFGMVLNPGAGDVVKVTVVATGFSGISRPATVAPPRVEAKPVLPEGFFTPREPDPPQSAPEPAQPAPEPVFVSARSRDSVEFDPEHGFRSQPLRTAEPAFRTVSEDELDVPAYLRQGQ